MRQIQFFAVRMVRQQVAIDKAFIYAILYADSYQADPRAQ